MSKQEWFNLYNAYLREVNDLRAMVQHEHRMIDINLRPLKHAEAADMAQVVVISNSLVKKTSTKFQERFAEVRQKYSALALV